MRNVKEAVKIAIEDDEMDVLGEQLDQQTYSLDGKKYKLCRTDAKNNIGYYTLIE